MTQNEPIIDPARPECAVGQSALQRMLDGETQWDSPEASAHRVTCVPCREELALAGSFSRLPDSVVVPAGLSERVLTGVLTSQRRRRWARFAASGVTLAASVLIFVMAFRPREPESQIVSVAVALPPKVDPKRPVEPKKPLGDSVNEAREAIVKLTKRTANETRDQSVKLLPDPNLANGPDAGEGLEPLADARSGAAKSVEPMRSSAKRAFNLFIRAADPPDRRPQP